MLKGENDPTEEEQREKQSEEIGQGEERKLFDIPISPKGTKLASGGLMTERPKFKRLISNV